MRFALLLGLLLSLPAGLTHAGPFPGVGLDDYEGDGPGECTDKADNDQDGKFDCDDDGCAGSPDCRTQTATGSAPSGSEREIAPPGSTTPPVYTESALVGTRWMFKCTGSKHSLERCYSWLDPYYANAAKVPDTVYFKLGADGKVARTWGDVPRKKFRDGSWTFDGQLLQLQWADVSARVCLGCPEAWERDPSAGHDFRWQAQVTSWDAAVVLAFSRLD